MKRAITIRLCVAILLGMLFTILVSYFFQIQGTREGAYQNSILRIHQVEQILYKNDMEIERLQNNLKEDYIIRAKAAAYIVENHSEIEYDLNELKKVAALLQVDELHLFDLEGTIYSGTEPKYYGYNFESGEQMSYFLPLLNDTSLQMCQDLTPNTAEGKLMQYTALWREDQKGIVQIGMEPIRLIEALEKNEIPYIFSHLTTDPGHAIYAVDGVSGEILGATNSEMVGRTIEELGIQLNSASLDRGFSAEIAGEKCFCVFRQQDTGIWIGVSSTNEVLYRKIPGNMVLSAASMALISVVVILIILRHIDRYILNGISTIIGKLTQITNGNLDTRIEVNSSPEFVELSEHVNQMVQSLLGTTNKLSLIFQSVNIPVAAFEYNQDMGRVMATNRLGDILGLSAEEADRLLADRSRFSQWMEDILAHPLDPKSPGDIYALPGRNGHFVKLKTYMEGNSTLGVLIDVTDDVAERQKIVNERDVDLLTGLTSRRAFFDQMEELFDHPDWLKTAVILMADVDNLKYVNDSYGHETGDRLLQAAAGLLAECEASYRIAARLSGDEFVLVLYGCENMEEVEGSLHRLEERMREKILRLPDGKEYPVRMSAGYVFYPEHGKDYHELLRMADQAMYRAKRSGKCRFMKYESCGI